MFDAFERVVGSTVADAAERRPRGGRADADIGGLHHVEVRAGRTGGGRDVTELIDHQFTHARHQSHRRVAPRGGHARREEHQRERGRARRLVLQPRFERFEETARAAGEIGSALVARALTADAIDGQADPRPVRREGQPHPAKRQRRDHGLIGRRELRQQALHRVSKELFATRAERLLVDDKNETAACRHAVVRAVGRGDARRSARVDGGSGRHPTQRPYDANAIGDSDFDFGWLEVGDRCAVGVDGDEIYGGAGRTFAGDGRLARRHAIGPTNRNGQQHR
jgi:hypothetical protein